MTVRAQVAEQHQNGPRGGEAPASSPTFSFNYPRRQPQAGLRIVRIIEYVIMLLKNPAVNTRAFSLACAEAVDGGFLHPTVTQKGMGRHEKV